MPSCYRHPDRETYIRCQRCNRPICPDCMHSAAVGHQCPDCVRQGAKETRSGLTPYGGRRSANPRLTTFVLLGVNVAVWLAVLATGAASSVLLRILPLVTDAFCWNGANILAAGEAACRAAPDSQALWVDGLTGGAWWQLITAHFVHVDTWHIAANMLSLFFLAPHVETVVGRVRFLAIALLSALGASAAVVWLAGPYLSTLGFSGVVFGLLGSLLVIALKVGGNVRDLLFWLGLNLVITFSLPGISWQGHLGGLVAGALATVVVIFAPKANRGAVQAAGLGALAVVLVALCVLRVVALG